MLTTAINQEAFPFLDDLDLQQGRAKCGCDRASVTKKATPLRASDLVEQIEMMLRIKRPYTRETAGNKFSWEQEHLVWAHFYVLARSLSQLMAKPPESAMAQEIHYWMYADKSESFSFHSCLALLGVEDPDAYREKIIQRYLSWWRMSGDQRRALRKEYRDAGHIDLGWETRRVLNLL